MFANVCKIHERGGKERMTTTTTRFGAVPENIAEAVRHSHGPTGDMAELSAQAQRLGRALDVAEKWIDAAGTSTEMWHQAEYTRDKLEEDLTRVIWQMEVLNRGREYKDMGREEFPESVISNALLSDTLIEVYCALRVAPEEIFGVGEREAGRRSRYAMMGALLAAQEAANAEVERAED
jgi:hypothetical protein